ncbi:MAG: symmetrical bis(5'-nucleosyl)-tetraphosphatase [Gammaproteobacteria bacterium]
MAVYVIGDVQGCYSQLCRLLEKIHYDQARDILWFCGDLVNRGPESLQSLRFVRSLGDRAVTVLGNHDLHLLALFYSRQNIGKNDPLAQILSSPDCDELMEWLRFQGFVHYDEKLNFLLVHAGIHADWDLTRVQDRARELEQALRGENYQSFLAQMYGDQPDCWSDDLTGIERLRCITNIFSRLRFYTRDGRFDFEAKGSPSLHSRHGLIPWFERNHCLECSLRVVFGHWSTLAVGQYGRYFAIDNGCIWGGRLTALRIDTSDIQWLSIDCAAEFAIN